MNHGGKHELPQDLRRDLHDAQPFLAEPRRSRQALADTYAYDADLENRAAIKELVFDAMVHSLVEHHGYKPNEIG